MSEAKGTSFSLSVLYDMQFFLCGRLLIAMRAWLWRLGMVVERGSPRGGCGFVHAYCKFTIMDVNVRATLLS
jgi:hypothetical protein